MLCVSSFEMREIPNRIWGVEKDGVFNGMIGQLQREESDFCTIAGPNPERLKAIHFLRGYSSDLITVTSLKPSLMPKHLSLIRPFDGMELFSETKILLNKARTFSFWFEGRFLK